MSPILSMSTLQQENTFLSSINSVTLKAFVAAKRGPYLLNSGLSQIIKSVVFVTSRKVDLFNKAEVLKIDLDFCVTIRIICRRDKQI